MKNVIVCLLLTVAVSSCSSDPEVEPPVVVDDAVSEFAFGPVESATVPVGLDNFDDGTEVLAARVDSETVLMTRSGPDAEWGELARVDGWSLDFEIAGDVLFLIVRDGLSGSREVLLRSVDRGSNWVEVDFSMTDGPTRTDLLDTGSGLLIVQGGEVFGGGDGGVTWNQLSTLPSSGGFSWLERFTAGSDGAVYARWRGATDVLRSSDGGTTWTAADAGTDDPQGFSVLAQPGGGDLYVHGASDGVVYTKVDGGPWESETIDALPDYFLFFEAFFFHDDALHALLGNDEATVVVRRTATDWELVYEGYQGLSGLYAVDWSSRGGVLTVVQDDLGHTIRQATIGSGTATEEALRFDKSVAGIRGGAVVSSGQELLALWSVDAAPGPEGGMDAYRGAAERADLTVFASSDGESWTERATIPAILPFEIDGGVAVGDGRIVVVTPVEGYEVVVSTSDDGGATFTERYRFDANRNLSVPTGVWHLGGDEWLFEIGFRELYYSDDRGNTWSERPDSDYFVAEGGGRLIGLSENVVYESDDAGATWSRTTDSFGAAFDAMPETLNRDPSTPSQLSWADDTFWLLNHIEGEGEVVRREDRIWTVVDTVDKFRPMEVVGGPGGVFVYGHTRTLSRDGTFVTSPVVRYASDGRSFSDGELVVPGVLGDEASFVDVVQSGAAHIVLMTSGDGRAGTISRFGPNQ